jgi:RHS repeat-associated protein
MEWDKKLQPSLQLGHLDHTLLGDSIDPHTGSLSFSHLDVEIPGNSGLQVALIREKAPGSNIKGSYEFGDWQYSIPRISVVTARQNPWTGNRCSGLQSKFTTAVDEGPRWGGTEHPDGMQTPKTVRAREYSHGVVLTIPGKTSSPLLIPSSNSPMPSNAQFVTPDNWFITCMGSTSNEGMIAHGPDGTRYTFSKYVSYGYPNMGYQTSVGFDVGGGTWNGFNLSRQRDELLATEVTDIDGNWVRYEYDSNSRLIRIHANDGRQITLTYAGSSKLVSSVTANGRVWEYEYLTASISESQDVLAIPYQQAWLHKVILPDSSTWEMQNYATLLNPAKGLNCYQTQSIFNHVIIKHPSGAIGTFELQERAHRLGEATGIQFSSCIPDIPGLPQADDVYPLVVETMAVSSKSISGPGLELMTWTYQYEEDVDWPRGSDGLPIPHSANDPTNWTKVIDPNGTEITYFHYWNHYRSIGGQLARSERRDAPNGRLMEQIDYSYQLVGASGANAIPGYIPTLTPASQKVPVARSQVSRTIVESDGLDIFNQKYSYNSDLASSQFSYGFPIKEEHWSTLDGVASDTRTIDITYAHDESHWALGLPKTVEYNGTEIENYGYNSLARLVSYKRFGETWRTFGYTTRGAIAWVRDAQGRLTRFSNYKRGVPQTLTRPDGRVLTATVDNNGWVTSSTNVNGQVTTITRNNIGWVTAVNRPTGLPDVSISYQNLSGGITQTTTEGLLRTVSELDGFYRPLLVTASGVDGSNVSRQRFEYDFNGQTTFASLPSTLSNPSDGIETLYDALGRVASKNERISGVNVASTSIDYLAGNRTIETNALGHSTSTTRIGYSGPYDGGVTAIDSPEGVSTRFTYDDFGNVKTIRQFGTQGYSVDETQHFIYDSRQRVCRSYTPETRWTIFEYNNANEVTGTSEGNEGGAAVCPSAPSATRISYQYDSLGRNTQIAYPDSIIAMAYDDNGNLTSMSRDGVNWNYQYSPVDQLESEQLTISSDNQTFTTSYEYDSYNRLTATTYPTGRRVTHSPDALGRATRATYNGLNYASSVTRHPNGQIASFSRGNGRDFSQRLNDRQLIDRVYHEGAFTWTYHYDAAKQLTQISANESAFSRSMTYDALGRLKTASAPNHWGTASYNYDALGNLRTRAYSGRSVAINYNSVNRVSNYVDNGVTRSFSYDSRGNVTASGALSFTTDYANQPTAITGTNRNGQSVNASYFYDGHHRRVKQTVNGTTIYSVYGSQGQLLHRLNATTNTATDYIAIANTTVAEVERVGSNDTVRYPYFDHLGSAVKMGNASGGLISSEQAIFLPFGERWGTTNQAANGRGFTGHVDDTELGLTYMQARYYDPVIGRFYSNDPVGAATFLSRGNVHGFNRYAYANNNPYKYIDPDGRSCTSADGTTTCKPEDSRFESFSFDTPEGWTDFEASDISFHAYPQEEDAGSGGADFGSALTEGLIASPTPAEGAATTSGATIDVNITGPFLIDNVTSTVRTDSSGQSFITNVTQENHTLHSGFVIRQVMTNGSGGFKIVTYGEGNAWKQLAPGATSAAKSAWSDNSKAIIEKVRE